MSQNQSKDNYDENITPETLSDADTNSAESSNNTQQIENLPIESIGTYARLEELLTDEEKGNTTNPTAQS